MSGHRTVFCATAALGVVLLTAVPADAEDGSRATLGRDGYALQYTAASGQANRVTVTLRTAANPYFYEYTMDDVYPVEIDPVLGDCSYPVPNDPTKVFCTFEGYDTSAPYYTLKMNLGDQDDTVKFLNPSGQSYYGTQFSLGAGNDRALTRQANGGHDGSSVRGEGGKDWIDAGDGGDQSFLLGGDGDDTMYVGEWGIASAGNGNDKMYGSAGEQRMHGEAGNDVIEGGDGPDYLAGGKGDDRLWGRKGNDVLYGNSGNDKLYGGLGEDELHGGPGKDVVKQK